MQSLYPNRVERASCGARKEDPKNDLRGTSNWLKDYIGVADILPSFPAKTFRQRYGIPRAFYKQLKSDLLKH